MKIRLILSLGFVFLAGWSCAQPNTTEIDYVKANYLKYEYKISMRDGKKLFTSVYVPKDLSRKYPIMMNRTPYSVAPYGADKYKLSIGPSTLFSHDGFIFVYQDVRGRWMSDGVFEEMTLEKEVHKTKNDVDEGTDTYDTIDWLIKNIPNNNGKVGVWGTSLSRQILTGTLISKHLKCYLLQQTKYSLLIFTMLAWTRHAT